MSRLLREPLLHVLLLGAGLFLVDGWIGGPPAGEGERIVITQGRVEQLTTGFVRMHQPGEAAFNVAVAELTKHPVAPAAEAAPRT